MGENEKSEPVFLLFSQQPFQEAEPALLTSSERQQVLLETASRPLEAEPASPDTIPEVDASPAVV